MKTSIAFLFILLNAGHLVASGEPEEASLSAELISALEKAEADIAAFEESVSALEALDGVIDGKDITARKLDKFKSAIMDSARSLKLDVKKKKTTQLKKFEAEIETADTSADQLQTFSKVFKNDSTEQHQFLNIISTPIDLLLMPQEASSIITIRGSLKRLVKWLVPNVRVFDIKNRDFVVHDYNLASFKKSKLRYKTLAWSSSVALTHEDLIGVVDLTFDGFNTPIKAGVLPDSLTHLTLGTCFNQLIEAGVLPDSITHLTYNVSSHNLAAFRASNLRCHTLIWYASEAPTHEDLIGVVELTFKHSFNQPLEAGVLPDSLTHLTLGTYFNPLIKADVLPPRLIHLTFSIFDGNLACFRASNLKCRTLIWSAYEAPTHEDLIGVVDLTFKIFSQPIVAGVLSDSITHLTFDINTYGINTYGMNGTTLAFFRASDLARNLRHLTLRWDAHEAPTSEDLKGVVDLAFNHGFNKPIVAGVLPPTLTHLSFDVTNYNLSSFRASSLRSSNLSCYTLRWTAVEAPTREDLKGVVHLYFCHDFNQPLEAGVLPDSLTHLHLRYNYGRDVVLPDGCIIFTY